MRAAAFLCFCSFLLFIQMLCGILVRCEHCAVDLRTINTAEAATFPIAVNMKNKAVGCCFHIDDMPVMNLSFIDIINQCAFLHRYHLLCIGYAKS